MTSIFMAWQGNPDVSGIRSIQQAGELPRPEDAVVSPRSEWTDEVLMIAIAGRDELAFSALYDRYIDLVYSTALRVLSDSGLAEDSAQEVFVRLWRRPETFVAERGRFLSWLMSVTRNRAVDELRARGRRLRREGGPGEPDELIAQAPGKESDDPLASAQVHEQQLLVRAALRDLPAEQRHALELAYFGGLTQQEVAATLQEPLGTVKTRIRLGMQKLRRALTDQV
ncbi:MAG: sigma-70 family RNA polymerase sigma factor [Tepidiformaceae bacterium]